MVTFDVVVLPLTATSLGSFFHRKSVPATLKKHPGMAAIRVRIDYGRHAVAPF